MRELRPGYSKKQRRLRKLRRPSELLTRRHLTTSLRHRTARQLPRCVLLFPNGFGRALDIPLPISVEDCCVIFEENAPNLIVPVVSVPFHMLSTFRKPIVNDLDFNSQASMRRILQEQIEE